VYFLFRRRGKICHAKTNIYLCDIVFDLRHIGVACFPPIALLGLLFGILSYCEIKRADGIVTGTVMTAIGTVLSVLGIVFAVFVVIYFTQIFLGAKERMSPRDATATVPIYPGFIGEGFKGSGFHFEWEGQSFIGCSLHQFDSETPEVMHMFNSGKGESIIEVPVTGRAFMQEDVQILAYETGVIDEFDGLVYEDNVEIRAGEVVYVMTSRGPLEARVMLFCSSYEPGMRCAKLKLHPTRLRGLSGSAVISGVTGTVVGVLLTGNEEAGTFGFEVLDLERSILNEDLGP